MEKKYSLLTRELVETRTRAEILQQAVVMMQQNRQQFETNPDIDQDDDEGSREGDGDRAAEHRFSFELGTPKAQTTDAAGSAPPASSSPSHSAVHVLSSNAASESASSSVSSCSSSSCSSATALLPSSQSSSPSTSSSVSLSVNPSASLAPSLSPAPSSPSPSHARSSKWIRCFGTGEEIPEFLRADGENRANIGRTRMRRMRRRLDLSLIVTYKM